MRMAGRSGPAVRSASGRRVLADDVYRSVLQRMLDGGLQAGDRLVMDRLAEEFKVSRTPVREALQRLHNEGAIEPTARRGYVVRATTLEEISQLYDARIAIEGHAATVLAGQPDRLIPVYEVLERVGDTPFTTPKASFRANRAVHRAVVRSAGNGVLLQLFDAIWDRAVAGLMFHEFFVTGSHDTFVEDHRTLLDAVSEGDGEEAREVMTRHIGAGQARTPASPAAR
jgi:DNA-binding GntR family transcriptional regulator